MLKISQISALELILFHSVSDRNQLSIQLLHTYYQQNVKKVINILRVANSLAENVKILAQIYNNGKKAHLSNYSNISKFMIFLCSMLL